MNKKVFKSTNTNYLYMPKIKYERLFASSWKLLLKHKTIFVPNLFMISASILWTLAYLAISGILKLLIKNPTMVYNQIVLQEQFRSFVGNNPIWAPLSLVIYMLLWFLTNVFFATIKYGMIKELILTGKTSLSKGYLFAKRYFATSMLVHMIRWLIIFGPIAALVVIFYIIGTKTNSFILMTPIFIIAIILLLVFAYIAYMMVRLLFIFPIMAFEELGALRSLKKDFHFVASHVGHTIITWILFLVVWAIYAIVRTPLGVIGNKAQNLFIIISTTVLITLLSLIKSVWENMFIFRAYAKGKDAQKRKVFKEDTSWMGLYK